MSRYANDREFEAEVRRVAEALFQLPPGECQARTFPKGKKHIEIDGVAEERELSHLLMATTSARLDKVQEDVEKLNIAEEHEIARGRSVKKWMVVELPPEGPQARFAKENQVTLLTLKQFRERFFDGRDYLARRKNWPFGSARDQDTNSFTLHEEEYIEPPFVNVDSKSDATLDDIVGEVRAGAAVVVIGPFGSGKSLTLREVWLRLRRSFLVDGANEVPLAINLREHWGSQHQDEILRRHGRALGMARPEDLIVAWQVGLAVPLVDGFDEIAGQGVGPLSSMDFLRRMRAVALIAVRELLAKTPSEVGILVTGRDHFFDSKGELVHALGLAGRRVKRFAVGEFDDERAARYLQRKGVHRPIPQWLPRKPLLLGYLVARGMLEEVLSIDGNQGMATAWTVFVEMICVRESQLDRAVMDPATVQLVLEELATFARATPTGTGPIPPSQLAQAYVDVTRDPPGDAVVTQLQRLPGLTERDLEPGRRSFIDDDLLATLQGAALARLIVASDRKRTADVAQRSQQWYGSLKPLAASVAAVALRKAGWTLDSLMDWLKALPPSTQLAGDAVMVALTWALEEGVAAGFRDVHLDGVHLGVIDTDEVPISGLRLSNGIVDRLSIGIHAQRSSLTLSETSVDRIEGVASLASMPAAIRLDAKCEINSFDDRRTTAAILQLPVDSRLKALLSILKKLFRQRGSGRVEGALHRGVPADVAQWVDQALDLVIRADLAWRLNAVIHPAWKEARRAHRVLDGDTTDPLVKAALTL